MMTTEGHLRVPAAIWRFQTLARDPLELSARPDLGAIPIGRACVVSLSGLTSIPSQSLLPMIDEPEGGEAGEPRARYQKRRRGYASPT